MYFVVFFSCVAFIRVFLRTQSFSSVYAFFHVNFRTLSLCVCLWSIYGNHWRGNDEGGLATVTEYRSHSFKWFFSVSGDFISRKSWETRAFDRLSPTFDRLLPVCCQLWTGYRQSLAYCGRSLADCREFLIDCRQSLTGCRESLTDCCFERSWAICLTIFDILWPLFAFATIF